jgi:hypothetical protein
VFYSEQEAAMGELKTKPTEQEVEQFLSAIADEQQREDSRAIVSLMSEVTGAEARMWGPSIVGFGHRRYRYADGRENDWMQTGFSPRKQNLTLYITGGFDERGDLLERLGKHKVGKGCLYVKRLKDVDQGVLRELVRRSVEEPGDSAAPDA